MGVEYTESVVLINVSVRNFPDQGTWSQLYWKTPCHVDVKNRNEKKKSFECGNTYVRRRGYPCFKKGISCQEVGDLSTYPYPRITMQSETNNPPQPSLGHVFVRPFHFPRLCSPFRSQYFPILQYRVGCRRVGVNLQTGPVM